MAASGAQCRFQLQLLRRPVVLLKSMKRDAHQVLWALVALTRLVQLV